MTQLLITMKIMILNPDASLAISCTGRNVIDSAIAIPVPYIAKCGVWYFVCTFSNALGNKLSRAMANGNREVAMIPANAIDVTTVTAKTAEITPTV